MKRWTVFGIVATMLILMIACVKDLEKEGIYTETEIMGTVVEKSTIAALPNIKVTVTDGERIHASATTGTDGSFRMKVNFSEVNDDYYLLLDGSPDLPSRQEKLQGVGKEVYNYKTLVLYDKTDKELLPQVTTGDISNILAETATASGTVSSSGNKPLKERGICYAKHQTPTITDSVVKAGTEIGPYKCNLTGLKEKTTYYVRAYATNSLGISYGQQKTFTTTNGLPTVTTTAVTDITATTAKSGGNVTNNGGYDVTERGICWNTMGNPDLKNQHTSNGSGNGSFISNMTDLTAGTTYYVRAYATNSKGIGYGNELTFTTSKGTVTLSIAAATNITASSATCNVTISSDGGSTITERGICWSTEQYPTVNEQHVAYDSGTGTFTAAMKNLTLSTTYYVRAYAVNGVGTSYSNQINFTTSNGLPTVTTSTISDITATRAVCSGTVTSDGGFAVTAKGFCWSTSQYPSINDKHLDFGAGNGPFTGPMTGLSIGTTYYVRAYATNSQGTAYGEQKSFTTGDGLPTVTTTAVTMNGANIVSGGNVTSDGGFAVTARGICYGNYPTPDITSNYTHTQDGTGTGYFTSNIGTATGTIYVRAYATNANGTSYGNEIAVNTSYLQLPTFTFAGYTYRVAPTASSPMTWTEANLYCKGLELYGYSDWQLPSITVLNQMYVYKNQIGGFKSCGYWSCNVYEYSSYYFRDMCDGNQGHANGLTSKYWVRPIRIDN